MTRFGELLDRLMPRQRRRMWRYVSPQRRGVALFLLVLLIGAIVGYQVMTSDARVTAQAVKMLTDITHCQVEVKEAKFNLFSGIKLKGVRISTGEGPPILVAPEIFLRHDPWQVVSELTIEPVEIVLTSPVVTRVAAPEGVAGGGAGVSGFQNTMDQIAAWGRRRGGLPGVRITNGRFRQWVAREGKLVPMQEERLDLVGQQEDKWIYRVALGQPRTEQEPGLLGSAQWDLASGDWRADLAGFDRLLPPELKTFLDRYHVEWGQTKLQARSGRGDLGGELMLEGLALKFPISGGVLRVEGVSGVLSLQQAQEKRPPGIGLRNVRGRLPALGGALVEIVNGTIDQATLDTSFRLELTVKDFRPHALRADEGSPLSKAIAFLQRNYKPEAPRRPDGQVDEAGGTIEANVELSRGPGGGEVQVRGKALVKGMTITYRYFPYRIEKLTGPVEFTQNSVRFDKLVASAGSTRIEMVGDIAGLAEWDNYRFRFRCTDVPLDEKLHNALPETCRGIWPVLSPRGVGAAIVDVVRTPPKTYDDIKVALSFDGRAGLTFRGFPYPIDELTGTVHIDNDTVTISRDAPVRGKQGTTRIVAYGDFREVSRNRPGVDMTLDVYDMPLDDMLQGAVGGRGGQILRSLHASGQISKLSGHFTEAPAGDLDYQVAVDLAAMSYCYEDLPYSVTGAAGRMLLTPGGVELQGVKGWHGSGTVGVAGKVLWPAAPGEVAPPGPRPTVTTALLTVTGEKIPLDEALATALPEEAREIWREFDPSGESDVTIRLACGKEGAPSSVDYVVSIEPRGHAAVTYAGFPYPFKNLAGQVIVTPRRVQFVNLTASETGARAEGKLWARFNWALDFDAGRTQGGPGSGTPRVPVLEIYGLPVDGTLMKALPSDVSSLFHRMGKEGKADVVLDRIRVLRTPRPATQPAGEPPAATRPASRPAPGGLWSWDVAGEIVLNGVSLNVGLGDKTLYGRFTGAAGGGPKGTGVDAMIALKGLAVGDQRLTEVEGHLVKRPESNLINVTEFSGRVHGGVVSGNIDIRTGEEVTYGVRLDVSRVRLEELFRSPGAPASAPVDKTKPGETNEVSGLLEGRLELVATAGKPERTKASGEIHITKAHMFKLPVVLELLHVVYLTPPGGGAFNEGRMSYQLKGNQLIFTEISLLGTALSVLGSGTVEMDSKKVNMAFISGPPPQAGLLRIDQAGPVLRGIVRELMEVQVTGTLDRPQMRPVPWTSLDAILRKLMNPEKEN